MDVLLGIVLAELLLTLAETTFDVLLGILLAELLLTLAEPADVLLLGVGLRLRLARCEATLGRLRIGLCALWTSAPSLIDFGAPTLYRHDVAR